MENHPFQQAQFNGTDPISEEFPLGASHTFTRKNRGRRTQIIDEEAKKLDDEFWNNNALFGESHAEHMEVVDILNFPVKERHHDDTEIHISHEINTVNHAEDIHEYHNDNGHGEANEGEDEHDHEDDGEGGADDDDDEDDEEYEQIVSSEEMVFSGDEEEVEKSSQKDAEIAAKEPDPEKEKEEAAQNLFVKNRENHLFYRPVFISLDLEDCEKHNFSYIRLPEELHSGRNENEISKKNINKNYIGVPPRAPEEFRLPIYYPTLYNREMFKCEDDRYLIDLNIIKYKSIIKTLDNICVVEDENEKKRLFKDIVTTNKIVKKKYDFDETEDEMEKLRNIVNEFQHDLENLYKKRAYSDIMAKKKKELYYPLAVRDYEFNYASNERQQLSNSKLVDEMSRNYLKIPLKRINSPSNEDIMDYQTFYETYMSLFYQSDLHKVLFHGQDFNNAFDKLLHNLFLAYRASPYSILPTNLFYISNEQLFNKAVQLVLYSIKHSSYYDTETLPTRLITLIQNYFGFELEEGDAVFDVESAEFQDTIEELVKFEHFKSQDFMKPTQDDSLLMAFSLSKTIIPPTDSNANFNQEFNLFIPPEHERGCKNVSYGTHYFFFVMKYFYIIYLKFLLVSNLSNQGATYMKLEQPPLTTFLNLTAAYILDKINNSRYELSVVNMFGSNAKYLLNIKSILAQITKGLVSLIDDTASFELMEKVLEKKNTNRPEKEVFDFTCEFMNNTDEDPDDTGNFVYRFHQGQTGWFLTSVFDVKGVFMRALKTQDRVSSNNAFRGSPKRVVVKRSIPPANGETQIKSPDLIQDKSETLLGKRTERESEKIEGPVAAGDPDPLKKVHID